MFVIRERVTRHTMTSLVLWSVANKNYTEKRLEFMKTRRRSKMVQSGRKDDTGKLLFNLVDPKFIKNLTEVLTVGAKKYAPENWKHVDDAENRYKAALLRHIYAYLDGEMNDSEDGLSHLAHASCNLMFLEWFDRQPKELPLTN
jgi:hypothetical protein